jgi:glyoxylase-like metal-dependent hydrolase (beta-lactamase superfamily II)
MSALREVGDRVYVLRYPVLDVNAGLVVGDGGALVVDTLSTAEQARELLDAVRSITSAPLTVVNSHLHFDHCFGNSVLAAGDRPVWAHESVGAALRERGEHWRQEWFAEWQPRNPQLAAGLAEVRIQAPDHAVQREQSLDIGGRAVRLLHPGRGHTDGDLVVLVPDADVVFAGDLVEQGASPDFADGYPLEWPDTLAAVLLALTADTVVVPGHGAPVDRDFVLAQHATLAELDWLIRDGHRDGVDPEKVAARSAFGLDAALVAVKRGYAELAGRV